MFNQKNDKTFISSLLCPKCHLIPFIEIKYQNIVVKCLCGYNNTVSTQNYLTNMNQAAIAKQEIKNCSSHKLPTNFYCKSCQEYLCSECNSDHNDNHLVHSLINLSKEIKISKIKQQLKEGKKYIDEYYTYLKEKFIRPIEEAYKESAQRSKNVLTLVSILLSSFLPNSVNPYPLIYNLQHINLQFPKFEEKDNNILSFFQNTQIGNKQQIDLANFQLIETIEEHSFYTYSLILLKDGTLVSCSNDGTIKFYNPEEYQSYLTINAHEDGVFSICELDDNKIVSCSMDGSIKIWKVKKTSYECLVTLNGHTRWVYKVISVPNKRIVSCSRDASIKMWDTSPPYDCLITFKVHTNYVYSLLLMSNNIDMISGSLDSTLRLWDINKFNNYKTIQGVPCGGSNKLVELDRNRVMVSYDNVIRVVNIREGKIEKIIEDPLLKNIYCLLLLSDGNLLCGGDGVIYLYEENKGCIKKKENCHNGNIYCMIERRDEIITCYKEMNVWKVGI